MEKKYNYFLKTFFLFIISTVILCAFPMLSHAQENDPQLFALVECMKVKPENESKYLEVEKNIWKPLHLERTKQGNIVGWFLYKVRFTGTDDAYNYVTVTLFSNLANIEDPWKNIDPAKVLPGKDLDAAMKETGESRDMVSSSLINRQASVYREGGPGDFKYIQLDYMKVEQGKENDYWDAETNIWKPVHQEFIKAGSRVGWSLWGRVFPSGAGLDYQYATVNYMADFSKIGVADYNDAFAKAHAGKNMDDLFAKTNASRVLVKSELWEVIDKAFAQ
jgi:L-rhamnose mutarotase